MSADVDIDGWLETLGYVSGAAERARRTLEEAGLTRPGRSRISAEKWPRAERLLAERFVLHCTSPACTEAAARSGREPVQGAQKSHCAHCGGSDNRRAEAELIDTCARAGVRRLVIVGGSPAVREELRDALGAALELRMVDGTERRTQDKARGDLAWADLVMLWGSSELSHKVSTLYTQGAGPQRRKLVHVARRGVAALLGAASEHLRRELEGQTGSRRSR